MKIKNYKDFNVLDFVEDEDFRSWILTNDRSKDFFWRTYLTKYPSQNVIIEKAKQLLLSMHYNFDREVNELIIPRDNFKLKLAETIEANSKVLAHPASNRNKNIKRWAVGLCMGIAAVLLLYVSAIQFTSSYKIEYVTGNGEWKKILLPDGSQVELNANSQLLILNDWEKGKDRQVWLKGEAFFKVEKKPSTGAKFYVTTKDLKVEVLGTMFNVNTRNERTEVFLEEGKIILDLDNVKEEIVPGEFIAYSQVQNKVINRYKKVDEIHSDWKKGVIKIDDATVGDILNELEIIYGIDVISEDQNLLEKEGSIAVPVDDLDMTMSILERVLDIKVRVTGRQYHIE
jgi:ferric-dicitrate binding protein FerR (iron transport regulator)